MLCGTTRKGDRWDWNITLVGIIILQLIAVTVTVAIAPEALQGPGGSGVYGYKSVGLR